MRHITHALAAHNSGLLGLFLLVLALILIQNAAVTSDAYITFRVIDNAVHGYGLRWNVAERVQVYTHPLWLLLQLPFYALWEQPFAISVGLSVTCTIAAMAVTLATFHGRWLPSLALLILPLAVSESFMVSSTLGLENPLTHLLFACSGWVLLRVKKQWFWLWFSLCVSLAMVNRLDNLAFYGPVVICLLASRTRPLRIGQCLLGSLPLVLWECFSLFYYGFLFPNTAYAKLPGGWINTDAIRQGWHYLLSAVALDVTSVAFLCLAITLPLYRRFTGAETPSHPALMVLPGIIGYCFYVLLIGGTYIAGRLWSLPFFAAIWLVYGMEADRLSHRACVALCMILIAVKLLYPSFDTMKKTLPSCFKGGIGTLWDHVTWSGFPINAKHPEPRPLPVAHRGGRPRVIVASGIGFYGYSAGPAVFIINNFAITDPLLARLPNKGIALSRSVVLSLDHSIPAGYQRAVETGNPAFMQPTLAAYYGKLRLIVSGDLWNSERLTEIIRFNLGDYNALRAATIRTRTIL